MTQAELNILLDNHERWAGVGTILGSYDTQPIKLKLYREDLFELDFSSRALPEIELIECAASGANFNNTDLQNANLTGTDFTGAYFRKAWLAGAILTNCNLFGTSIEALENE